MKVELSEAQWTRTSSRLPKPIRKPIGAGGREPMIGPAGKESSGSCARGRDLPDRYPKPVTCWRRPGAWERADVWLGLWRAFHKDLDEAAQLD